MITIDPGLGRLTDQQLVAAATPIQRVFIEASPGSGKTTVAAQRFGAQRYAPTPTAAGLTDDRSVTAVSFTRSATWELLQRVRQTWGPASARWPHRIVTLDTLVYDLLGHLLATGRIRWPGGHVQLEVHDSWKVLAEHSWIRTDVSLQLVGADVVVRRTTTRQGAVRVSPHDFEAAITAGKCTHDEVRRVLAQALARQGVSDALVTRLAATTRALIVDEVFDANNLDIAVIELAAHANVPLTVIGDPWQALYGFRGALLDLTLAYCIGCEYGTGSVLKTGGVHGRFLGLGAS